MESFVEINLRLSATFLLEFLWIKIQIMQPELPFPPWSHNSYEVNKAGRGRWLQILEFFCVVCMEQKFIVHWNFVFLMLLHLKF